MNIIIGQQNCGPTCIPRVSLEEASQLFTKLYDRKVDKIKTLVGYVTQNFYIKTSSSGDTKTAKEYVFKICPFQYQNMKGLTDVSIKTILYLNDCGIVCPAPLKTIKGKYVTTEEVNCCRASPSSTSKKEEECITQSACLVYTLTYLPGNTLEAACPKSVPLPWFKDLGQYLARIDKALMDYPHIEDIPMMTKQGQNSEWSLNTIPRYRALLHVVQDDTMRNLIESVIDEFDKEVVPKIPQLRTAMIYNDFNQNNIIAKVSTTKDSKDVDQHTLDIIGIIDFNDICCSCILFEIGIASTYMMYIQKEGDRLAACRQFLQGYESLISLTEDEWQLLPLCIAARCVQGVLAGLYSFELDPTNEYVRRDIENGYEVLMYIRGIPSEKIVKYWRGQASD
ncbi:hydroxylysine kinase-like [Amphiura filiformis]|uniref:hydroxylysine kinase-like n=1 Tax=Amphiura filiformis TaxID=82378 RepID=UPI003B20C86E